MLRFYPRIVTFACGILLGYLLAVQFISYTQTNKISVSEVDKRVPSYDAWFRNQGFKRKAVLWDVLRYDTNDYVIESRLLFNKITVYCIVLVRNDKNARAAQGTWAKGCTSVKLLQINTRGNKTVPIKRKRENSSWILLCKTLRDTSPLYDWILVANDNTFVILENLRHYVASLDAFDKYYLGYAVIFWNIVYNSGEAGYVLSKGSLIAFKQKFSKEDCSLNAYWNREDFYLGKYLSSLNITPVDTRDGDGLSTFHPYNWYHVFFPGDSYYKTSVFPVKCCSRKSIAFQAIEGDKMYTYYYLLYTLQIFLDGYLGNRRAHLESVDDEVWKGFLKERNIPSDNISSQQYYKIWEDLIDDPNSFAAHMKKETDFDYN